MIDDPPASAKAAGLRYVTDATPGISRRMQRGGFKYTAPGGKPIADKDELARIRALAVPPAYTDVWICPNPNGHLQATGRDARGRKQYRYHKRWTEIRDETKYERMIEFARALPRIRKRVDADLKLPGLPREKVLAAVVQLLESTLIRVGNEEYAKENNSYGLTTMKNRHAEVSGGVLHFTFPGKSGVRHAIDLHDRRLSRIVRACQDLPGQQLFSYQDDNGEAHGIDSADVNDYIREISARDFSAKDFRTWVGTVQCAVLLSRAENEETQLMRKQRVADAIKHVSSQLGNTPSVCRKCYVHPDVVNAYMTKGELLLQKRARKTTGLLPEEASVLAFLRANATPLQASSSRTASATRASRSLTA